MFTRLGSQINGQTFYDWQYQSRECNSSRQETDHFSAPEWTYQDISFVGDGSSDFVSDITSLIGTLEVISGVSVIVHQGKEIVFHTDKLVVFALDIRHFHVVGGWTNILKLLSCERRKLPIFTIVWGLNTEQLPVKISRATKWTLAWPCFPVLEVDISTILQGRF